MQKTDDSCLEFLWAKWAHHDNLLYNFGATFWGIQAIAMAGFGILADKFQVALPVGLALLGLLGLLFFRPSLILARVCRNTYNDKIVSILLDKKIIGHAVEEFELDTWDAAKDKHPANLWHTPILKGPIHKVRGSAIMQNLIVWVSSAELLLGSFWGGYLALSNLG